MVYPHSYRTEHSETKTTNSMYGDYYAHHQSKKIAVQPDLLKIIQYIDSYRSEFIKHLSEAVAIKSVSGDLQYRDDVKKMIDFAENWFLKLGMKYERFNIGYQELEGKKVRLPTTILASLGDDPNKRTICLYMHLDVKKPDPEQWVTDPWKVTLVDKNLYGSGVASGKAVLIHWCHIIQAFQGMKVDFPVNLKFVVESMYYHNSLGLSEFLPLRKHDFFVDIHSILVCDSQWLGDKHPCLTYGTVGMTHYDLFVRKVEGTKTEPQEDLEKIFKELMDDEEHIMIPQFHDIVTQITPEEEKMYESITDFDLDEARKNVPAFKQNWDKVKLLMYYWRLPSMYVGETEKCTCEIKSTKIFKRHFVVKLVPRQILDRSVSITLKYIDTLAKTLNIQNKVTCKLNTATRYWYENPRSPHYQAARRATIQIFKEDPNMIREDRERVVLTVLDRVLESNITLLPIAASSGNIGGSNENISQRNFFETTKLLAAYLFQIALIK